MAVDWRSWNWGNWEELHELGSALGTVSVQEESLSREVVRTIPDCTWYPQNKKFGNTQQGALEIFESENKMI